MGRNTKISWTDHTWNPWQGCARISSGCKFCYMYRDKKRYGQDPTTVVRSKKPTFNAPLKWKDEALVFTCSWSDFFLPEADEWRDDAWDIIRRTPHLTYQILTKRPDKILDRLPPDWPLPNVWLGVTVEDNDNTWRLNVLADIPAILKFISYEPALEFVCFAPWLATRDYEWFITGGETGAGCRPSDKRWFIRSRNTCYRYGIPFLYKQFGGTKKIDGVYGGAELDGRLWQQIPRV